MSQENANVAAVETHLVRKIVERETRLRQRIDDLRAELDGLMAEGADVGGAHALLNCAVATCLFRDDPWKPKRPLAELPEAVCPVEINLVEGWFYDAGRP